MNNVINNTFYLTLCTFSFEIKESSLSDTRCLIQDVVSPHCGDKRMAQCCPRRTTLSWRHIIGMWDKTDLCNQCKHSDSFIHSYYVSQISGHIIISKDIVSIFPVRISPNKKALFSDKESDRIVLNVTLVNERQKIMWRQTQNAVSIGVLYKVVTYLKFIFIEMLEKLITYIVCWYKTLYQVLSVAWTSCITTRRYCDS
jgi:hypothetical protein